MGFLGMTTFQLIVNITGFVLLTAMIIIARNIIKKDKLDTRNPVKEKKK